MYSSNGKSAEWFAVPSILKRIHHKMYLILEEPQSSRLAMTVNLVLAIFNIASCVTYFMESIPVDHGSVDGGGLFTEWEYFLSKI